MVKMPLTETITIGSIKAPMFVVLLLAASLIAGLGYMGLIPNFFGASTMFSSSNLKLITASPLLFSENSHGFTQAYLTNIQVSSSGGQLINGGVSDPLQDKDVTDGKTTSKSFTIAAKMNKFSCDYPVNDNVASNHDFVKVKLVNAPDISWSTVGGNQLASGCRNDIGGVLFGVGQVYTNSIVPSSTDSRGIKYWSLTTDCARDFNTYCTAKSGYVVISKDKSNADSWAVSAAPYIRACVSLQPTGEHYKVYSTQPMIPNYNITIGVLNSDGTEELDSITQNKNTINTKDMYADFSSLSYSGAQFCPSETAITLIKALSGETVTKTSVVKDSTSIVSSAYDLLNHEIADAMFTNVDTVPKPNTGVYSALDNYNMKMYDLLNSQYSDATTTSDKVSYVNGYISVNKIAYAPFVVNAQMIINASWLGLTIPQATPQIIIAPKTLDILSGRQGGTVQVSIYNTENFAGTFKTSFTSCPFTPIWQSTPDGLYGPYQTKTLSLTVPSSNVADGQQCTVQTCSGIAVLGTTPKCSQDTFTINVANECTTPVPAGKIRVSANTCDVTCQTPASTCTANGQTQDPNTCLCVNANKVCTDGTQAGMCSSDKINRCSASTLQLVADSSCATCTGLYNFKDFTGTCVVCNPPMIWNTTSLTCKAVTPPCTGNNCGGIPPEYIIGAAVGLLAIGGIVYVVKTQKKSKKK